MSGQEEAEDNSSSRPVAVRVLGVYVAEISGGNPSPVVLLEDESSRIVPIFVGLAEALSIHHALCGEVSPRPMTHDLFISALEYLEGEVSGVLIDELDGGVFYARLSLRKGVQESEIDARPSDCIALAIRARAPIHVNEMVMGISSVKKEDIEGLQSLDRFFQ